MRILCVTAHPDDETVFAGGTLALLASLGLDVKVLCCTRGEGGEAGEPPLCARDKLGAVREAELRCAVRALGCSSVDFLTFRDPDVSPDGSLHPFAGSPEEAIPAMAEFFRAQKPDVLITHGSSGEYGHPAHLLTHQAALQAARDAGVSAVFTFSADYPAHPRKRSANRNDPADFIVNIEPALERKRIAMECHRTQNALFVRRASAEAGHPVPLVDVIVRRESFHRVASSVPVHADARDIVSLLGEFLAPG
jgi:LmbE family N-acetylglucosaminyl deacetylase